MEVKYNLPGMEVKAEPALDGGWRKACLRGRLKGIATGWQGNSEPMEAVLWQELINTPLWRIQMFVLYLSKASLSYGVCATRTQ